MVTIDFGSMDPREVAVILRDKEVQHVGNNEYIVPPEYVNRIRGAISDKGIRIGG